MTHESRADRGRPSPFGLANEIKNEMSARSRSICPWSGRPGGSAEAYSAPLLVFKPQPPNWDFNDQMWRFGFAIIAGATHL